MFANAMQHNAMFYELDEITEMDLTPHLAQIQTGLNPQDTPVPACLGEYRIRRLLGRGGTARVFLAERPSGFGFHRKVALKVASTHAQKGIYRELLIREARIQSDLHHPAVPAVYELGQNHGLAYYAMEWIEGWTLSRCLRQCGPLPLSVCLDVAIQLCQILQYFHGFGTAHPTEPLVHGDIKPANIMVDGFGRIHLIDFGIATMGAESACAGRSFGTLAYMAPEQIMQEPLDGRTDQFALGALLYELVTGQRLFPENTIKNMAMSRIQTLATPLAKKGGWGFCTPLRALLQLLKQCVMVNPSDRFQNIEVLSTRLHKVQRRVRKDASLQTWIEHQIKQQTLDFDAPCAE